MTIDKFLKHWTMTILYKINIKLIYLIYNLNQIIYSYVLISEMGVRK